MNTCNTLKVVLINRYSMELGGACGNANTSRMDVYPTASDTEAVDWPQRIVCVQFPSQCGSDKFFVNCVTAQGELAVYSHPQLKCALRRRIHCHQSNLPTGLHGHRYSFMLAYGLHEGRPLESSRHPEDESSFSHHCQLRKELNSVGRYQLALVATSSGCLDLIQITVMQLDARYHLTFNQTHRVCITPRVHSAISIPAIGLNSSELWFGQSECLLSCYIMDLAEETKLCRSENREVTFSPAYCWPVSSNGTGQSTVNALAIDIRDMEPDDRCKVTRTGTSKSEYRVWSYLYPDHEIACWSSSSRIRLWLISLLDVLPPTPPELPDFLSSVQHMEVLPCSRLMLTDGRGHVLCVSTGDPDSMHSQRFRYHDNLVSSDECSFITTLQHVSNLPGPVVFTLHRGLRSPTSSMSICPRRRTPDDSAHFYLVSLFSDHYLFS